MFSWLKRISAEKFIDIKFRKNYLHYILQSFLIFICITAIMLLSKFLGGIVVASLGATSFILFVTPHTNGSRPRYVIGGYLCGTAVGTLFNLLHTQVFEPIFGGADYAMVLLCAAAVAVTTFIMIVVNTEHPPGAALALGLVAGPGSMRMALAALAGVLLLCAVRRLLKKYLKNLI